MKRAIQFATVAFALSMLAAFVAYSEQKAGRPVPHSKRGAAGISTNVTLHPAPEPAVAPGSKSLAPLVRPPLTSVTNTQRGTTAPLAGQGGPGNGTVAWDSKYGRVVTPTELAPDDSGILSLFPATIHTGQVIHSTKSAPVVTPSTFPVQGLVSPRTNRPPRKAVP